MSSGTKQYIVVEVVHMVRSTVPFDMKSQKTLSAGFIIVAFIFPFQTKSPKSHGALKLHYKAS